jgi:hypothetical protein
MKSAASQLKTAGQSVRFNALQDFSLDRDGDFYELVLAYLIAATGLTPVYDGEHATAAELGLEDVVKEAHDRVMPADRVQQSLCRMLVMAAYESISKKDRERLWENPVFQFLRHTRNAASHDNVWKFRKKEPALHAEWGQLVIDETRKGDDNPLQNRGCFFETLEPADLLYLLQDVEAALRA